MRKVLNVGGNSKEIPLPSEYAGWEHVLLDIDPNGAPDIVCDARELSTLPGSTYDSVYYSHNLEHYYRHDAVKVLAGFVHVLKDDGFAVIRVPDLEAVMQTVVAQNLDIDDLLYQSTAGLIAVQDVIYGFGMEIEQSGNDFFAHKAGFTKKSLTSLLNKNGFQRVFGFSNAEALEVIAVALISKPSEYALKLFHLPSHGL
jgi:SAM-dependent methyltransferase